MGIILLAHGSRRQEANEEVAELARIMEKEFNPETEASHAFLQFGSPGLKEAIKDFINRGCNRIAVAPLFLTTGVHIKDDIPELLEEIKKENPGVSIVLCRHLGCDSRLLAVIRDRVEEGLNTGM